MMLPLFQELHDYAKEHGFIFFVLTNHIERFDPAVKRRGRFDLILPLGPPDHQSRFRYFENCLSELGDKYKDKYNLVFLTEYDYTVFVTVTTHGKKLMRIEPISYEYTNLDVLARASHRLSLADIKAVCEHTLDRAISMRPSLRKNNKKGKQNENSTRIYTSNFIDWITKFRNSDLQTQQQIDSFYHDAEIYSRGSTPYPQANTTQEKVEHLFSSLIINHNINKIKNWKKNQTRIITFSLRNVAEFGSFHGTIKLSVKSNDGTPCKKSVNTILIPGRSTKKLSIKIKPTRLGSIKFDFVIDGLFVLTGSELILDENRSSLSGKVTTRKEIKINS